MAGYYLCGVCDRADDRKHRNSPEEPDYVLENGNIRCAVEYPDDDKQSDVIATLMASTRIGCLQLEDSYGKKFVTVNDVFYSDTET